MITLLDSHDGLKRWDSAYQKVAWVQACNKVPCPQLKPGMLELLGTMYPNSLTQVQPLI